MKKMKLKFIPDLSKRLIEKTIQELNLKKEDIENITYKDKLYKQICRKANVYNGDLYYYLKGNK